MCFVVIDRIRQEIRAQASSVGRFGEIVLRFVDVIESVSFLLLFVSSVRGRNQMSWFWRERRVSVISD